MRPTVVLWLILLLGTLVWTLAVYGFLVFIGTKAP